MTEERRDKLSDRRHPSLSEIVAIVVLIIQLGALIWGAATLSAAVKNLQLSVSTMQNDMRVMSVNFQSLITDVRILQIQQEKTKK